MYKIDISGNEELLKKHLEYSLKVFDIELEKHTNKTIDLTPCIKIVTFKAVRLKRKVPFISKVTHDVEKQILYTDFLNQNKKCRKKFIDDAFKERSYLFNKDKIAYFRFFMLKRIIISGISELEINKKIFTDFFYNDLPTKIFLESILYKMYTDFSASEGKNGWSARDFIETLNIKVCPYCNMNYTHIYYKDNPKKLCTSLAPVPLPKGTCRPDLDHFYPRGNDKFPILSMSIFNLIPSCLQCNRQIKHMVEMNQKYFIHPYSDTCIDDILFFIRDVTKSPNPLDTLLGINNDFEISVRKKDSVDNDDYDRACRTLEFFHVIDLYDYRKDYIQKRYRREVVYSEEYLDTLTNAFPNLYFFNDYKIEKENETLGNETLGKILNDLFTFKKNYLFH